MVNNENDLTSRVMGNARTIFSGTPHKDQHKKVTSFQKDPGVEKGKCYGKSLQGGYLVFVI